MAKYIVYRNDTNHANLAYNFIYMLIVPDTASERSTAAAVIRSAVAVLLCPPALLAAAVELLSLSA